MKQLSKSLDKSLIYVATVGTDLRSPDDFHKLVDTFFSKDLFLVKFS